MILGGQMREGGKNLLPLDDLVNIVAVDLNFSFQCCSTIVVRQVHGCPIGGFISSIYANIKCARDEYNFMRNLGAMRGRIYAIRQVDDLIFWAAYDRNSDQSKFFAKSCLKSVLTRNEVYTGGLELEEQDFQTLDESRTLHKFAGTLITVTQNREEGVRFDSQPLNKIGKASKKTVSNFILGLSRQLVWFRITSRKVSKLLPC
jgi:hypothetical protein